jgi:aromatic-L-amino-acid/L-tryptophan decarboxylase
LVPKTGADTAGGELERRVARHSIDEGTNRMIRSILALAENRRSYLDVIHADDDAEVPEWNPTDYAHHLTRRARGLPLWFSLAGYGIAAYRQAIETTLALARETAALTHDTPYLELVREPDVAVVLFRRIGWKDDDYVAWADALMRDQVAFVPPSKWAGETVARLVFPHPDASMDLVREILERMA